MRTTTTLDPEVVALLHKAMKERGISFKEALNSAVKMGLTQARSKGRSFVQKTGAICPQCGGDLVERKSRGRGKIFWSAFPVELAEDLESVAGLYAYVTAKLNIKANFELRAPAPPGVLIAPIEMEDSILYVMASDQGEDVELDIRDALTGTAFSVPLHAQHAAIAVVSKKDKTVAGRFGF